MEVNIVTQDDFKNLTDRLDRLDQRINESKQKQKYLEIYSNSDLAKLLKVSHRCLQNWRDNGLIDFIQIRSKIFYTVEDVQRFLNTHKIKSYLEC